VRPATSSERPAAFQQRSETSAIEFVRMIFKSRSPRLFFVDV
jgi:hypothetical protein